MSLWKSDKGAEMLSAGRSIWVCESKAVIYELKEKEHKGTEMEN